MSEIKKQAAKKATMSKVQKQTLKLEYAKHVIMGRDGNLVQITIPVRR